MMETSLKKVLVGVVALVLILTSTMTSYAASVGFTGKVPLSFETKNCKEIFNSGGKTYIVQRDNVAVRENPEKSGKALHYLNKGDVLISETLIENAKHNLWVQTIVNSGDIGYVYIGNLQEHTSHQFVDLAASGNPGYLFCRECAYVKKIICTEEERQIILEADKNRTVCHVALTVLAFVPVVGNVADVVDGLLSLSEGDFAGAAISFAAVAPLAGIIGNAAKTAYYAYDITDLTGEVVGNFVHIENANKIYVTEVASSRKLGMNMTKEYAQTGKVRFFKEAATGGYTWAAHHIVAGSEEAAAPAREVLLKVGLGINDAANGVFLCMRSDACTGTIHSGRHTQYYYDEINALVTSAYDETANLETNRRAVEQTLDRIADRLRKGELPL